MSSSGITPVSSGPLIIRAYLNSSVNNTFILGNYDIPVSSNRILLTSSNGLLNVTDNVYISSISASTIDVVTSTNG